MEKIAHDLASRIAVQLQFDKDKEAVIAYGLTAIFQIVGIAAIISVIGVLSNTWLESFIIFFGVGLLKKSTGGAHSQTIYSCTVISVLSISVFALASRYIFGFYINTVINMAITAAVFFLCFAVYFKKVPVDSPNKPIKKLEKIKRLRRQSYILLILYTLLTCCLAFLAPASPRLYSIIFSIRFVLLWQALMLTEAGSRLIELIDMKIFLKEERA